MQRQPTNPSSCNDSLSFFMQRQPIVLLEPTACSFSWNDSQFFFLQPIIIRAILSAKRQPICIYETTAYCRSAQRQPAYILLATTVYPYTWNNSLSVSLLRQPVTASCRRADDLSNGSFFRIHHTFFFKFLMSQMIFSLADPIKYCQQFGLNVTLVYLYCVNCAVYMICTWRHTRVH